MVNTSDKITSNGMIVPVLITAVGVSSYGEQRS